jgi:hypothetical protein
MQLAITSLWTSPGQYVQYTDHTNYRRKEQQLLLSCRLGIWTRKLIKKQVASGTTSPLGSWSVSWQQLEVELSCHWNLVLKRSAVWLPEHGIEIFYLWFLQERSPPMLYFPKKYWDLPDFSNDVEMKTLSYCTSLIFPSCINHQTILLTCPFNEAAKILFSPSNLINLWYDTNQTSARTCSKTAPIWLVLRWNPSLQLLLWQSHNFERLLANEFTGIICELAQLSFCKSELPGRAGLKACKRRLRTNLHKIKKKNTKL